VLFDLMLQAKAFERLHDPSYIGALNAEQFLEAALEAGIPEDDAQKMATERANKRMDQGLEA
jgi:hypothetical protein